MTAEPQLPAVFLEPGVGLWHRAQVDEDGLPLSLDFLCSPGLDATGTLFAARVTGLDKSSDMAFLDLGNGRTGVLSHRRARLLIKGRSRGIAECVTEGQVLLVQALHDPCGAEDKGISVTPRPRLAGRYITVEFGGARLNFSKDLSPAIQKTLESGLSDLAEHVVVLIRSGAARVPTQAVIDEAQCLAKQLIEPIEHIGLRHYFSPMEQALIQHDVDLPLYLSDGGSFAECQTTCRQNYPDLTDNVLLYKGDTAFDEFGVWEAVDESLSDRIELPSGGWIAIYETPALTAIDVNMGTAYRAGDAAEAKLMVNLEAAMAIAFHMRFQNLGGLIVVDFIDMTGKDRIKRLLDLMTDLTARDIHKVSHTGLSAFGLMTINRPRRGGSLRSRLRQQGPDNATIFATINDLLRASLRLGQSNQPGELVLTGPEKIVGYLRSNEEFMAELVDKTQRKIQLEIGPLDAKIKT